MSTQNAPDLRTSTLECGARLAVERVPNAKSAALCWIVPAGAASDPPDRVGLAPLIEELLLRGAGERSSREMADAFDLLGASRDTGVQTYHLSCAATFLGDNFPDVAPLVVDTMLRPAFDEDAVDPVRQLAIQSLRGLVDEPQSRVMYAARERHAPAPINRTGLGSIEGLEAATREDIVRHWRERAKPRGSVIAVAGAVDPDRVTAEFNGLLTDWKGEAPAIEWSGAGPRGYHHIDSASEQTHIAVIHDAPAEASDEAVLERLAVAVLSGGMSGRLFTEVREKRGLCYAVSAGYSTARDFGRVVAYSGTTPERAQTTLDVLVAELRRINSPEGAATASELERARIGLKSKLVMSGESTSSRASSLAADVDRLGRPRTLEEIAEEIDAVTLGDLNGYLSKRDLGDLTVVTLGPKALEFKG